METERARSREKLKYNERATQFEKLNEEERADGPEKLRRDERAMLSEELKEDERATHHRESPRERVMTRKSGPNGDGSDHDEQDEEVDYEGSAFLGQRSAMATVADVAIGAEHIRVGLQVRKKHLVRRHATCERTDVILERARDFEDWVDDQLKELVSKHPAAPWFLRIKGVGESEALGKVLGHIEAFGRFYEPGDPLIPDFVNRDPVIVPMPTGEPDEFVPRPMIWVEGIERLMTPSKLRKYAGLLPGMKREAGKESPFNTELRTMFWRVGTNMIRAKNKYAGFYDSYKLRKTRQLIADGYKILPTPKGRFCPACQMEVVMKKALFCPKCGGKLTKKEEPEGVYWQGHVHMMVMRRMIQLFSDHLWVVWREALGLPIRDPYPIEYLGHTGVILAENMVDR